MKKMTKIRTKVNKLKTEEKSNMNKSWFFLMSKEINLAEILRNKKEEKLAVAEISWTDPSAEPFTDTNYAQGESWQQQRWYRC